MYYPWFDEEELITGFQSYEQSYVSKQHNIASNAKKFNDDCKVYDISPEDIENNIAQSVWEYTSQSLAKEDALTKKVDIQHCKH